MTSVHKMKAQQYAEALYQAVQEQTDEGADACIAQLVALVRNRGHERLLPAIVREYEKLEQVRDSTRGVVVRLVDATDRERHAAAIDADRRELGATNETEQVVEDNTVVGGYSVEVRGRRIDRTHKRALFDLYSQLVTK